MILFNFTAPFRWKPRCIWGFPRFRRDNWMIDVSWLGLQFFCMDREMADVWLSMWTWARERGAQREIMRGKGWPV